MLLEDNGFIRDLQAAALVDRDGAVDWLCLPRLDSASCFSALLGDERHGRWLLAPAGEVLASSRRYRPGTLVLESEFETAERFELEAPVDRWKGVRDEIHRKVCERGYDRERGTFTQYYGSKEFDAATAISAAEAAADGAAT